MPTERGARAAPVLRAFADTTPLWSWAVGGVWVFSLSAGLLALVPALFSIQVYDRVLGSRSGATLAMLLLVTLVAIAGAAMLDLARQRLLQQLGAALERALSPRLLQELALGLPTAATGQADLARLRSALSGPAVAACVDLVWLPLVWVALALLHPLLGGLAALGLAGVIGAQYGQQRWHRHRPPHPAAPSTARALTEQARLWRLQGRLADGLGRWQAQHQQRLAQQLAQEANGSAWSAGLRGLKQALQSLLLAAGAWLVIGAELTPGVMVGASLLFGRLLSALEAVQQGALILREAWPAAQRLAPRLAEPLVSTAPAGGVLPLAPGALRLLDATFGWPGQPRPLLHGLRVEVAPGELIAVIGPAGVGKTSFAKLLLGLLPPVLGQAWVDGASWRERELAGLAPRCGWWGEGALGAWSQLGEAIHGGGDPDEGRLREAAQAAGLLETIQGLPTGWQTPLGPQGWQASSHQRLALELARLLHAQPQIAVFDEPGQLTDGDEVRRLRQQIQELHRRGCTVLILTGRASWAQLAPRWLLLRDGALVADGPAHQVARQLGLNRIDEGLAA